MYYIMVQYRRVPKNGQYFSGYYISAIKSIIPIVVDYKFSVSCRNDGFVENVLDWHEKLITNKCKGSETI